MRMHVRTWHVGWPVEEGLYPKDQILQEEYEFPVIGTSRANGQRGSEWGVVRKRRCFHAGASLSVSSSTVPPACPSGARELPKTTRRLIREEEHWPSKSPQAPVR